MELSYLLGPDINALVLEAGYRNIDSCVQHWSHLMPPAECLAKVFVTKDGLSIQEVVEQLTEVGRSLTRDPNLHDVCLW